jgi:hypothetical protein
VSGGAGKAEALRLLRGLEDGGMTAVAARAVAEKLDPVLLYVVVRYLRDVYPASNPAASAVLERVVALTRAWPGLVARAKQGEAEPVAKWFARDHTFREFRGRPAEMIDIVVDKLEG